MNICPFHKYKDILGVPNTGVHSFRFLNTAVFDYVLTIIASIITTYFSKIPLVLTTIFWLVFGIVLHMIFGVETNTIKYLNLTCS